MNKLPFIKKQFISFILLANIITMLGLSPVRIVLAQDETNTGVPGELTPAATLTEEVPVDVAPTQTPWEAPLTTETATNEPTSEPLPTETIQEEQFPTGTVTSELTSEPQPTGTDVVETTLTPTPTMLTETPTDIPANAQAVDCSSVTEITQAECTALIALYNATNGTGWTNHAGWLEDNTPCDWFGVTCESGHVQKLTLNTNNLVGTLPTQLQDLTSLTELTLYSNQLNGSLPSEMGNLTSLVKLFLQTNKFSGSIPSQIGNLSNLTTLDLSYNNFSGSLPVAITSLSNLTYVSFNNNHFSGSIPVDLATMTNLIHLYIDNNDLTGTIPAEFTNLTNLYGFGFDQVLSYQNDGSPDTTTVCLQDGAAIETWYNGIHSKPNGNVKCSDVFTTCSAMTQIPPSECDALLAIKNSTNESNWNYIGSTRQKWFYDNTPCDWHGISCESGHLKQMWLFSNNLVGSIPKELGNLQYLQELEIQNNQLSGQIPPELGNMTGLKKMNLSVNQLTGSIPPELGNLTNLTGITLSYNQLSGNIPPELGNLTLVTNFILNNNRLSGSIPPELGNISSMIVLSINDNLFSGSLPLELTALNLRGFAFENTNVCIPANTTFSSWLSDIAGDWGVTSNGNYCYPSSPVLIGPEGNQSSSTVTFRWNEAENASNYHVYVLNNNVGTRLDTNPNCVGGTCEYTFTYDPYCGDPVCYDIPAGDSTWWVRASNPSHSIWSNGLIINIPPAAPILRFPTDGDNVSGIPLYQWNASANANLYEFQYDTSGSFDSGSIYTFSTAGLSHQPPAQPLGEYFWRVRARNAQNNWGKWSTFRVVNIEIGIPPAPALTTPPEGSLFNNGDVNFAWGASTDGNTYQIQIAPSNTFSLPGVDVTGAAGVLSYSASGLADGKYYWRVRSINSASTFGTWSLARSFTVDRNPPPAPVLSSPANNSILRTAAKYIWKAVSGAARYQLQYDDENTFTDPLFTSDELIPAAGASSISFTPNPAQPLGTYYWRVRARDAAGNWGDWSIGWLMDYRPLIPAAPLLTAPGSAALLNDNTPWMEWTTPENAAGFEILIDTETKFATPIVRDVEVTENHFTALAGDELPDGKLYWKVRAKNSRGEYGNWSVTRNFTVDSLVPAAPLLSAPANYVGNNATVGTPTYTWLAVLTAKKYILQIDTVNSFDSGNTYIYEGAALTCTPPLQPEGAYFWRVKAYDAAGNDSGWSETRQVMVTPGTPPAPALTSPLNNTSTNNPITAFDWEASVYGVKYELAIDSDAKFALPVYRIVTNLTETGYTPDTALANNKYYWRVRAQNASGVWGAWSAYRVLTVNTAAPALPVLKTPANNSLVRSAPTFTWAKPTGAVAFLFQYASDVDFTEDFYESSEILVASHQPPAMPLGLFYWRVNARDAAGNWSGWTSPWAVDYRAGLPAVPVVLTPAKGAVLTDNTPQFTWKAAANAVEYEIAVADGVTFAGAVVFTASGTDYTLAPEDALSDGVHYWHMRARNASGEWSLWSAYRNCTMDTTPTDSPELTGPADGSTVSGIPTYTWNMVSGATYYQFRYDDDETFTDTLYTSPELKATLTPTQSYKLYQAPGVYYWQVQSRDAYGNWSGWGEAFSVIVAAGVPAAPALGSPAANATVGITPTFSWSAVTYGNIYQVQIDNSNLFDDVLIDFNGDAGELTFTVETSDSLPQGTYYWRVRAYNVNSEEGLWSAYRSFKVDATAPLAPVLNIPANDADVFTTPTYTWKTASTAVKYEFQYASNAAFTEDLYESGVLNSATALSHKPPVQSEGMYYWRVRACDAFGNWSLWSEARTVNVLLSAPVLLAPANGSLIYNPVPTFSWNALAGATFYQYQLDNSSTFNSPEFSGGTSATSTYGYGFTTTGVYYWRVRGVDSDGTAGAWSAAWKVDVRTRLPN